MRIGIVLVDSNGLAECALGRFVIAKYVTKKGAQVVIGRAIVLVDLYGLTVGVPGLFSQAF